MSTASLVDPKPEPSAERVYQQTVEAFNVARQCTRAAAEAITSETDQPLARVRELEDRLDTLDREINEGVTSCITRVSETEGRELLANLKFVIELERISDLMLGFANRMRAVIARLSAEDLKDLSAMASLVDSMLGDAHESFSRRDLDRALAVLRADGELDRLRNLIFLRHIENPEGTPRQESFHVVIMSQTLERAGDHAKNVAEEVCHLVSGRSIRHLLRATDKPFENMFLDMVRKHGPGTRSRETKR
jgi:phosphate transport system protein